MPAVDVVDLTVRYGEKTAVDGLSFAAEPGTVLALLGPNGAGKTTTVETLEGYKSPTGGTVRVLGLDPRRDRSHLMPRIGVMLQEGGVYPAMTPAQVLRLFCAYYGDRAADPGRLLDLVDLRAVAGSQWRRLSGGEKQRLSLALALAGQPDVAFLDEPSAGVDPSGRRQIWEIIAELRRRGACVVLTTHDMEEAARLADDVVIIDNGRAVATGSPDELMRSPTAEIRFAAPAGVDVDALSAELGAPVRETSAGEYLVPAEGTPAIIARLTAWLAARDVSLTDLRSGRQSLEDVFLRLTEKPVDPSD